MESGNHGNLTYVRIVKALLVRLVYAINGIVLTVYVNRIINEQWIFLLNALCLPLLIEFFVTLRYRRRGEWTWFIPSVMCYLLWVVPSIIVLEVYAFNFRVHVTGSAQRTSCTTLFYDDNGLVMGVTNNATDGVIKPDSHDLGRYYSYLFQQIMMVVLIFGRWLAPKGKLNRDQLSALLLALTAMATDMLEFLSDSLGIEAVACDKVYVGFIILVWCWSLLQFPLGLTAMNSEKGMIAAAGTDTTGGQAATGDDQAATNSNRRSARSINPCRTCCHCCSCGCCCGGGEIWALLVVMLMQDVPYLALRLYIIFSTGYVGQTLVFFTAKNVIVVMLQIYRMVVMVGEHVPRGHKKTQKKKLTPTSVEDGHAQGGTGNDGFAGDEQIDMEVDNHAVDIIYEMDHDHDDDDDEELHLDQDQINENGHDGDTLGDPHAENVNDRIVENV